MKGLFKRAHTREKEVVSFENAYKAGTKTEATASYYGAAASVFSLFQRKARCILKKIRQECLLVRLKKFFWKVSSGPHAAVPPRLCLFLQAEGADKALRRLFIPLADPEAEMGDGFVKEGEQLFPGVKPRMELSEPQADLRIDKGVLFPDRFRIGPLIGRKGLFI